MFVWSWYFLKLTVFKHLLIQFINLLVLKTTLKRIDFSIGPALLRLNIETFVVSGSLKEGIEGIIFALIFKVTELILVVQVQ
jgi:hypothetical protein